jgi:hypothetical protein
MTSPPPGTLACEATTPSMSSLARTRATLVDGKRGCCGLNGRQKQLKRRSRLRVGQERQTLGARCDFLQQRHPFTALFGKVGHESGDVATRVRDACDHAASNRVGDVDEYDGNAVCRANDRLRRNRSLNKNGNLRRELSAAR